MKSGMENFLLGTSRAFILAQFYLTSLAFSNVAILHC